MNYFIGDIDADCYILEEILSTIEYKSGSSRYALCKTKKGNGSILYGNTWRSYLKKDKEGNNISRTKDPKNIGKYLSKAQESYPELMDIMEEFRDLYFPDFKFTHLMLNKNYPVDWHLDAANVGESVIIAVGDFLNGEIEIKKDSDVLVVNVHNKPYKFNGSKLQHRAGKFTGDRYAVVFFNN